jgi:hypothetical protein
MKTTATTAWKETIVSEHRQSYPDGQNHACESQALVEPLEALFSNQYVRMLTLARFRLAKERAPVSACTLVHELYLKLRRREDLKFGTHQQFLAY